MEKIKVLKIPQAKLSSECWMVQFQGLNVCKGCEFKGKRECGGKSIRKRLVNEKGFKVPLR